MNRRLLILDEDPNSLELLSFILCPPPFSSQAHEPFEITAVRSAEQAVEQVRVSLGQRLPFAGAFVDMGLGKGVDGPQALIRLRSVDPELILVAITTSQAADSVGWDLLAKPFTETQILQKANQIVTRWEVQRRDRKPGRRGAK